MRLIRSSRRLWSWLSPAPRSRRSGTSSSATEERFSCNFPGQPTITETTWTSQFGAILPARVYTGTQGTGRFVITVVDYRPIQRLLSERSMSCTPGAETCQGIHDWGLGYWKNDVRGAVTYAASSCSSAT